VSRELIPPARLAVVCAAPAVAYSVMRDVVSLPDTVCKYLYSRVCNIDLMIMIMIAVSTLIAVYLIYH
jgi:hypothetical protein